MINKIVSMAKPVTLHHKPAHAPLTVGMLEVKSTDCKFPYARVMVAMNKVKKTGTVHDTPFTHEIVVIAQYQPAGEWFEVTRSKHLFFETAFENFYRVARKSFAQVASRAFANSLKDGILVSEVE